MAVSADEIKVDDCYVTTTRQVRRVLEVDAANVRYASRGSTNSAKWWEKASRVTVSKEKFASDVDRKVTCDWDGDYDERKP